VFLIVDWLGTQEPAEGGSEVQFHRRIITASMKSDGNLD
jgi:hypothetical protein